MAQGKALDLAEDPVSIPALCMDVEAMVNPFCE